MTDLREFYLITAGSDRYGKDGVVYQLKNRGLSHAKEAWNGFNLMGNNSAWGFDGLTLEEAYNKATELTSKYKCDNERCGCHLCYFKVVIDRCDKNGNILQVE